MSIQNILVNLAVVHRGIVVGKRLEVGIADKTNQPPGRQRQSNQPLQPAQEVEVLLLSPGQLSCSTIPSDFNVRWLRWGSTHENVS